ncbi:hypothetical protein BFW38_02215 [Terasakiispira papahanaumokuakeensis]|uniref:diguanylate cyclase n=1 Tax=Terasakiispira papahanaumokuakeensis TaxID=197479 RepID=A0A1E2V6D2_9GAMM|nr:diguanylate cyclase [Terasakiispira papahanaumokuakeensis]ODC02534.1 hypothetical protein BFW38_02215 [Terasakiispira papahanaumokuakeensis]
MLKWLNASMTRKISGLSFVLLSFLLIVILYSVYKLQSINQEMREVADIDIPLTDTISQIDKYQLQQDLLLARLHELDAQATLDHEQQARLIGRIGRHTLDTHEALAQLESIIQTGLHRRRIRLDIKAHRSLVQQIHQLRRLQQSYSDQTIRIIDQLPALPKTLWAPLHQQEAELDRQMSQLLAQIETLTQTIATTSEHQERNFMLINATLGISALGIGLYLTLYIIQSFRTRLGHIQTQIKNLQNSLHHPATKPTQPHLDGPSKTNSTISSPVQAQQNGFAPPRHQDELSGLEQDLRQMLNHWSETLQNRDQVEQHLLTLATTDQLTGIFNRHKWDEQISQALDRATTGEPFSVLLVDVDYFKQVNDQHGHDVGDQVLYVLAQTLSEHLLQQCRIFRLGGEEFAILMLNTDDSAAQKRAETLRSLIEAHQWAPLPSITISIGGSSYQKPDNAQSLLKRADQALYEAKKAGRNQVSWH